MLLNKIQWVMETSVSTYGVNNPDFRPVNLNLSSKTYSHSQAKVHDFNTEK